MTSDPLRRLTAGLAEEERLARAAADSVGACWEHRVSEEYPGQYASYIMDGEGDDLASVYSEDAGRYIAHISPRTELRRVEAIRKAIEAEIENLAVIDGEWGDNCSRDEIRAGKCTDHGKLANSGVIAALASIYPEEQS